MAEHLQRAIEAICTDNPSGADSSAEKRGDAAASSPYSPSAHKSFTVRAPQPFT